MGIPDLLRLILLAALWGASFLFVRLAIDALGSVWLAELRVSLAAAAMLLYLKASGLGLDLRRHWRALAVVGVLNTAFPWWLYAWAGNYIGAGYMAILNGTAPWFAAVCGALWLGEAFSWRKAAGLALGTAGVALIVGLGPIDADANVILAVLGCIVGSACYAVSATYVKKRASGVPPLQISAGSLLFATVVLLPALPGPLPLEAITWKVALAVLGIALLCSAAAYLIFFRLIASVGPTKTMTVTFLIPVFGVLWGALFLGERVDAITLIGTAVILIATALVLDLDRRRNNAQTHRG